MIKSIFGLLFLSALGLVTYLLIYLGFFKEVRLNIKQIKEPISFIFKEHLGPYHEISPVMDQVAQQIKSLNLDCKKSIGRFLDDPDRVDQDRLRSEVGCTIFSEFSPPLPQGLSLGQVNPGLFLVGEFEGSPSMGPVKVYPKAEAFMNEKGYHLNGPIVEIYELLENQEVKTHYLFPIRK